MNTEKAREFCYKDMQGDAKQIVSLILNAYFQSNIKYEIDELFSHISEDELNKRYFKNINWKLISQIAISAQSRQETYNYLKSL